MILNERNSRHERILDVARQMTTTTRTAPKGEGIDIIETAVVIGKEIQLLSDTLRVMFEEMGVKFFSQGADNILQAECILSIGTREQVQGLNCGYRGHTICAGRAEGVPCTLNSIDTDIAIGSVYATAAGLRIDTRVMFSAGLAAQHLDRLKGCR